MPRRHNIHTGTHNIKIEKHSNGALTIEGPDKEDQNSSYAYEEQDDGSHKTKILKHLDEMYEVAMTEGKQQAINFVEQE